VSSRQNRTTENPNAYIKNLNHEEHEEKLKNKEVRMQEAMPKMS